MKIRSAQDVIAVARARGFKILLDPGPPPMPFLRGDTRQATQALMVALKAWRVEIMDALTTESCERNDGSNGVHHG